MAVRVVTAPSGPLISLADAKLVTGIDTADTSQDSLLTALLDVATTNVEFATQRYYRACTLEWTRDDWAEEMRLPVAAGGGAAYLKINSVKYAALDFSTQTLDPGVYWERPQGETLAVVRRWFSVWPFLGDGKERVVINFSILSGVVVPSSIKQAALMVLGTVYEMTTRSPYLTREHVEGVGLSNWLVTEAAQRVNDRAMQSLLQYEMWA